MYKLLAIFILIFASPAFAFYCELEEVPQKYKNSDAVFIAKIDKIEQLQRKLGEGFGTDEVKIYAQAEIIFKGLDYDSTHVIFYSETAFNHDFKKGERYLIYAQSNIEHDKIILLDCPRPTLFNLAQAEIAELNNVKFNTDYQGKIQQFKLSKQNTPQIITDEKFSSEAESAFYEIPLTETEYGKKKAKEDAAKKLELDKRAKSDMMVFDADKKPKEANNLDDFDNLFNTGEDLTETPKTDADILKEESIDDELPDLDDPENPYF